jgi:hypothetical protein
MMNIPNLKHAGHFSQLKAQNKKKNGVCTRDAHYSRTPELP